MVLVKILEEEGGVDLEVEKGKGTMTGTDTISAGGGTTRRIVMMIDSGIRLIAEIILDHVIGMMIVLVERKTRLQKV